MPSGSEAAPAPEHGEPTLERMTVNERLALVQDAIGEHGEGFLAWFIRGQVDYSNPGMVEEFTAAYGGWYPDRSTFTADQLLKFDWSAQATNLCGALGLPPDALRIDEDSVWEHCTQIFAVEERLGGVHVFTR